MLADRELVEQGAEEILEGAGQSDVAFLVVGDPLRCSTELMAFMASMYHFHSPSSATTHADLLLRALERGIPYQVVHNASILNAIGCCGLQLYHFGETVSIPFWTETWKPDSFVDRIEGNLQRGLHTLCLLGGWGHHQ